MVSEPSKVLLHPDGTCSPELFIQFAAEVKRHDLVGRPHKLTAYEDRWNPRIPAE